MTVINGKMRLEIKKNPAEFDFYYQDRYLTSFAKKWGSSYISHVIKNGESYLYRQIKDKKVRETINFLLNREEAHNQMFRDAFNKVQQTGSNRDFGTTKAAKMCFSMSNPIPNAFANGDTHAPSFK